MKKFQLLAMLLMMAFVSCAEKDGYEKSDRFSWDDFKEVRALKGKTLEFDTPILRPRDLQILDSVLVVIDYNEEKRVSSAKIKSTSFSTRSARKVMSSKLPTGVGTMYNIFVLSKP